MSQLLFYYIAISKGYETAIFFCHHRCFDHSPRLSLKRLGFYKFCPQYDYYWSISVAITVASFFSTAGHIQENLGGDIKNAQHYYPFHLWAATKNPSWTGLPQFATKSILCKYTLTQTLANIYICTCVAYICAACI